MKLLQFYFSLLLVITSVLCEKKIVYCFTNYNEESFWEEKGDFFKKIFEPKYEVKFTKTTNKLKNYAYIVTLEVPHNASEYSALFNYPKEYVLLFSFEGQITHPLSHNSAYHACYSKVFTWNDDLIDNQTSEQRPQYFKTLFPYSDPLPPVDFDEIPFSQKKLCVLMGTNNEYNHPVENYSGRKKLIDFFEGLPEVGFEFYGYGWNNRYKNYRGFIDWNKKKDNGINFTYSRRFTKINIIKNYKFDIVYENCKNQNGYLTERLFDSFAAGCVPVYWGSKNIHRYIPRNCMVMRNEFATDQDLYEYLKNMSEERYKLYQSCIKAFLESEEIKKLKTDYFIEQIRAILKV